MIYGYIYFCVWKRVIYKMKDKNVEEVKASLLDFKKYNNLDSESPNNTEYEKLRQCLEYFGYVEPVIVNKNGNIIIEGHSRYKILVDMGYEYIDVVYVDLSESDEQALYSILSKLPEGWYVGGTYERSR